MSSRSTIRAALIAATVALTSGMGAAQAATCQNLVLQSSALAGMTITQAVGVPGPMFNAPDTWTYTGVPSFCKVSLVLTPTSDSFINVELWLPTTTWNGRFQALGNGGYGGTIAQGSVAMVAALQAGFAVANTDMGTAPSSNGNGDALIGHPQKWIDWGSRATHLMTVASKQVIEAFYGHAPRYSYFNGCSTGGQQALQEAQRFPDDYDGILGGNPASNRTHGHTAVVWNYAAYHKTALSQFFSTDQTKAMSTSVAQMCAAKSGGVAGDPFLTDPRACDWDPAVMQCTGLPDGICLTADQVVAARTVYQGARNPRTGRQIFPGLPRGSEADTQFGWANASTQTEPSFDSLFKWVFGPAFSYLNFNFDTDVGVLDSVLASNLNANSTDLSAFRARGGKLLMYHGWADPLIAPQESINYYENVVAANRTADPTADTQSYYRLFMVPGMYHCAAGPGPNAFGQPYGGSIVVPPPLQPNAQYDIFRALQDWVENGRAPNSVIATKYVGDSASNGVAMTRPLCVYPLVAKYTGRGATTDAANFVCAPSPGKTDPAQVTAPEYRN